MEKKSPSFFSLTCVIALVHFCICFVIGFLFFTIAFGQGLSDSYQGESPLQGFLAFLLYVLEAPIALVQWIAIKFHPQTHTGLPLSCLIFFGVLWSVVFGWLGAVLYKKNKK